MLVFIRYVPILISLVFSETGSEPVLVPIFPTLTIFNKFSISSTNDIV